MTDSFKLSLAARETPTRVALVLEGESWSYARLWELVEPVCGRVKGLPGVAFEARNGLDELCTLFACLECEVPLLLLHPRLPLSQQKQLVSRVEGVHLLKAGKLIAQESRGGSDLSAQDAVLLATSGSTGLPKVVRLSRNALLNAVRAHAERTPFKLDDRWLLSLPFAHVGGLSILLRCLASRSCVVVSSVQPGDAKFIEEMDQLGVTLLSLVPTQVKRLLDAKSELKSLRLVLVGGAACDPSLRRRIAEVELPVRFTYGMTEAASQIATQEQNDAQELGGDVGRCLNGFEWRLEADSTLSVRGPQMFHGYLGQCSSPFDEEGWFNTGDRAEWNERHRLCILGRRDRLLISGGENVSPEYVEAVIGGCSIVRGAVVVGIPDLEWGQRVVAAVELADSAGSNWEAVLSEHCRAHLAGYQVPKHWLSYPQLPSLPNGKPDHSRLVGDAVLRLSTTVGG